MMKMIKIMIRKTKMGKTRKIIRIRAKINIKQLQKETQGQGSAEMILLIGALLVIVIIAGTYVFNISNNINNSLKNLIEKGRDSLLYEI